MTWGMTAVAAATAVSAAVSSSQASAAAAGGANAQNRQIIRHNKKVVEANVENSIRTGFRVGLLNLQQGQAKKEAALRKFDIGAAAQQVLGANSANAAAAGTVGASVQAVEADIYQKLGEAQAAQDDAWDVQLTNFNNQLHTLITEGKDTIVGADGEIAKVQGGLTPLETGVLAGATSFASQYGMRKMRLGLGQPGAGASQGGGTGLSPGGGSTGLRMGGGTGLRLG